jgi:hypothetical protein
MQGWANHGQKMDGSRQITAANCPQQEKRVKHISFIIFHSLSPKKSNNDDAIISPPKEGKFGNKRIFRL